MLDPSTVESSRKIVYNASVRMETTDYDTTRAALVRMKDQPGSIRYLLKSLIQHSRNHTQNRTIRYGVTCLLYTSRCV